MNKIYSIPKLAKNPFSGYGNQVAPALPRQAVNVQKRPLGLRSSWELLESQAKVYGLGRPPSGPKNGHQVSLGRQKITGKPEAPQTLWLITELRGFSAGRGFSQASLFYSVQTARRWYQLLQAQHRRCLIHRLDCICGQCEQIVYAHSLQVEICPMVQVSPSVLAVGKEN